jgi:hypothetical protein
MSPEKIAAFDYLGRRLTSSVDRVRRKQGERSVRAFAVVVSRVGADDVFEMAAAEERSTRNSDLQSPSSPVRANGLREAS